MSILVNLFSDRSSRRLMYLNYVKSDYGNLSSQSNVRVWLLIIRDRIYARFVSECVERDGELKPMMADVFICI